MDVRFSIHVAEQVSATVQVREPQRKYLAVAQRLAVQVPIGVPKSLSEHVTGTVEIREPQ